MGEPFISMLVNTVKNIAGWQADHTWAQSFMNDQTAVYVKLIPFSSHISHFVCVWGVISVFWSPCMCSRLCDTRGPIAILPFFSETHSLKLEGVNKPIQSEQHEKRNSSFHLHRWSTWSHWHARLWSGSWPLAHVLMFKEQALGAVSYSCH